MVEQRLDGPGPHETENDPRSSRGQWLRAAGVAFAGAAVASAPAVVGAASKQEDKRVLALLLLVEQTEVAFYTQALDSGALKGKLRDYASTVLGHEKAHLAALEKAAGGAPEPPQFAFGSAVKDPKAFTIAAGRLEDVSVAAYNGQAANVSPKVFVAAAQIVSVEARHAAWVRSIAGRDPAPAATDEPRTDKQVRAALSKLGVKS